MRTATVPRRVPRGAPAHPARVARVVREFPSARSDRRGFAKNGAIRRNIMELRKWETRSALIDSKLVIKVLDKRRTKALLCDGHSLLSGSLKTAGKHRNRPSCGGQQASQ